MRKLAVICFSFSAAIFISHYLLPAAALPFLAAAFILMGVYFVARPAKFLVGITLSVFALSLGFGAYYAHYQRTAAELTELSGLEIDINAKLISYPVNYDDYSRAEIRLKTEGLPEFKAIIYDNYAIIFSLIFFWHRSTIFFTKELEEVAYVERRSSTSLLEIC